LKGRHAISPSFGRHGIHLRGESPIDPNLFMAVVAATTGAIGGLFHHINFGGDGFGGGGGGGMGSSGALSAGERGQYAGIIRKVAMQEGVDPRHW
jgi:hypothetical protein